MCAVVTNFVADLLHSSPENDIAVRSSFKYYAQYIYEW